MLKEFKAFAMKGNLIDIAVGLILALAFSAVVTAFVDGVMLNLIAAVVGEPSFDSIVWTIGSGPDATEILVGSFLSGARQLRARCVGAVLDREGGQPRSGSPSPKPAPPRSSCSPRSATRSAASS